MEKHNIHITFEPGATAAEIKEDVWQYDFGQVLQISGLSLPPVVEVHYANKGEDIALPQTGVTEGGITTAPIPNEILEEKGSFTAYIFVTDGESGETCYTINGYVNKRPPVKGFNAPEDQEILHAAVGAVNAAAERAESAEAKATEAAKKTAEDAKQTAADRAETERLVESVSGIGEQVTKVENLTKQAQTSATNAALSEQAAKTAETNAQTAQAGAETAEGNAELAERNAKASEQAVEKAKQLVTQMGQEVLDNKNHVDQTVQAFDQTAQQAVANVNNAGQTQTERVQSAGNTATESVETAQTAATQTIETAKTEATNALQAEGATQTGNVSAEGAKQVQAVQAAAQEIVADREQIKANKKDINDLKTSAYTDMFFRNFFAMQRTGKKYTVRFPLWETSQVATGEKLNDNEGLVMEPSTITEKGRDDYETIPLFRTYDCNVEKIDGKLKITAMKGDTGFDPKEKDTFVLGMPYYHKAWEKDGYLYYSRSDTPHEGYVLCPEARKINGMRNFCLYGKYVAGRNSQGTLGSYYGVSPTRNLPSYNNNVTEAKKRGDEYCFGSSYDYAYIQTTFLLKYANKNWNTVLGGCFAYNYQYLLSVPESNTKRVVLKKSEADKFLIGSYVIVGDSGGSSKAPDRSAVVAYNLCDSAKILDIVNVDENNKALVLDITDTITTTATTWVSTIHWKSGFSNEILGRDGCLCQTKSQISSILYPSVIQGIELMAGGYEVPGNTFMDIVDGLTRDVYVCTDSTKLTTNVTTAKETYVKLAKQMTVERNSEWNYGTEIFIDTENGMNIITKAGASGSGTNTGFCDGIYFDVATSGQREFLLLGNLWAGSATGAFYSDCSNGLGNTWWGVLARLSLNVFRGEFA